MALACGSSSQVTTGPTPVKCQVALAASASVLAADGGSGNIAVSTTPECTWTATTEAAWIAGLSPRSGQGSGNIGFTVAANAEPSSREGRITVNDAHVNVQQAPAPCRIDVAPRRQTIDADGGARDITVTTFAGCRWDATSDAPWITITSGHSGNGNGVVHFSVSENTDAVAGRSGSLSIAGQLTVIDQAPATATPPGCVYTLSTRSASIVALGGTVSVAVQAPAGCAWTAASLTSWITITSGASGSGPGSVAFTVAANQGASRTAIMTIAGQAFTVNQAGNTTCTFSVSPTSQSIGGGGGSGTPVTISTTAGCAWTAVSNVSWITITSGTSGSGPGTTGFNIDANSGSSRTGTLTIAGQTFTVTQAAASSCSFTINPTSHSIAASGGPGTPVAVSTAAGCSWTARSDDAWISITSGNIGSGSGTVSYSVAANSGRERMGRLTIAGHHFNVTQASGCVFVITPTSQSVAAQGGSGQVAVSTAPGCDWTATSNAAWITANTSGGSGPNNGFVNITVAPNTGPNRMGTVTIADQTFTVLQNAAPPCTFAISPASAAFGPGSGNDSVAVSTAAGCAWTATSHVAWITIDSGSSGTGNGTVKYDVATNILVSRNGTMTIAGRTFTVTQAGLILSENTAPAGRVTP